MTDTQKTRAALDADALNRWAAESTRRASQMITDAAACWDADRAERLESQAACQDEFAAVLRAVADAVAR